MDPESSLLRKLSTRRGSNKNTKNDEDPNVADNGAYESSPDVCTLLSTRYTI
jgi:hypothetical protein